MEKPINVMSNKTEIHIISTDDYELAGYVYFDYLKKTFHFNAAWQMMSILENIYNNLSFPQASFEFRTFENKNINKNKFEGGLMSDNEKTSMQQESSSKATFVVKVQFRQNATWQGTVDWLDGKKSKRFRSTLELIKLMDEAVNLQEPEDSVEW